MERAQLLRNIEEMKALELQKQQEKQERVRKMILEVEACNKESIKLQQQKKDFQRYHNHKGLKQQQHI